MGDDAPRDGSIADQAWPDLELATQAVGGVTERIRVPAEVGRSRHQRTLQCRGSLQGIAAACPRLARCKGWQTEQVSDRRESHRKDAAHDTTNHSTIIVCVSTRTATLV